MQFTFLLLKEVDGRLEGKSLMVQSLHFGAKIGKKAGIPKLVEKKKTDPNFNVF